MCFWQGRTAHRASSAIARAYRLSSLLFLQHFLSLSLTTVFPHFLSPTGSSPTILASLACLLPHLKGLMRKHFSSPGCHYLATSGRKSYPRDYLSWKHIDAQASHACPLDRTPSYELLDLMSSHGPYEISDPVKLSLPTQSLNCSHVLFCFVLFCFVLFCFPLDTSRGELDGGQSTAQGKGAMHHVPHKCPKACLKDVIYTLPNLWHP